MFGFMFGKKLARKSSRSARRDRVRPRIEALEDRRLMATLAGISSVAPIYRPVLSGSWLTSLPPALTVNLTLEPHDQITAIIASKTTELYSFQLQQGEFFQAHWLGGSVFRFLLKQLLLHVRPEFGHQIPGYPPKETGLHSTGHYSAGPAGRRIVYIRSGNSKSHSKKISGI